jgi:hypothetical protein
VTIANDDRDFTRPGWAVAYLPYVLVKQISLFTGQFHSGHAFWLDVEFDEQIRNCVGYFFELDYNSPNIPCDWGFSSLWIDWLVAFSLCNHTLGNWSEPVDQGFYLPWRESLTKDI